ncbi:MAG: amidase [Flammeovirgaceae bacterium]
MMNLRLPIMLLLFMLMACQNSPQQPVTKSPTPFQFAEYTIAQFQQGFDQQKFTIEEVTQAYLQRIEAIDKNGPAINSVIQVNPDAIAIAQALDKELQAGKKRSDLHGIPVLLKDNIDTHDQMPTTAGSRALKDSKPLQDSFIAQKLREAGAVILGKTNLSEWANFRGERSTSGWSGLGGQTKNPYRLDRNPCGSSSGSGVAVSANLCVMAVGTETNGSIVCPSSANGVVGIKPTVGLLSRSGIIPISFSQDTPGPMTRTVTDAAISLGLMVGKDPKDAKTEAYEGKTPADYTKFLNADGLNGKRIGLYTGPLGNHAKVDQKMEEAVEFLKSQGAEVIEIDQISQTNVGGVSFNVMLYEYKDGLNNYFASLGENAPIKNLKDLIAFNEQDSVELRYFDQEYLKMAQEKGSLEDQEYKDAVAKMHLEMGKNGIDRVMDEHQLDAIIAPTNSPAWKTDWTNGDSFVLGSSSPAAISGYPNITVPMGFIDELPVGMSIFGRKFGEGALIEIAYAYEQGTKHRKAPQFLEN